MDNKISLRITRYQRLAMEHVQTLEELELTRAELRKAGKAYGLLANELNPLVEELEQVKRERDAAVADITEASPCFACKHFKRNGGTCGGGKLCFENAGQAEWAGEEYKGPEWEWRGVQEAE